MKERVERKRPKNPIPSPMLKASSSLLTSFKDLKSNLIKHVLDPRKDECQIKKDKLLLPEDGHILHQTGKFHKIYLKTDIFVISGILRGNIPFWGEVFILTSAVIIYCGGFHR